LATKDFTGKEGEIAFVYPDPVVEDRVVFLGFGELPKLTLDKIRLSVAHAVSSLSKRSVSSISLIAPVLKDVPQKAVMKAIVEGAYFGGYQFREYRTQRVDDPPGIRELVVVTESPHLFAEVAQEVACEMDAVALARNLVNKNADEIFPEAFAAVARSLATSELSVTVHGPEWIERERMGLLMAVARGARYEPRCIIVEWKGAPKDADLTVLVGKGITYDTGGLHLKTESHMDTMKSDMAGAAAVLATMQAVRDLRLPLNISAVIPLCENAIGPLAYKPGDVYKARSGKSVEIRSTDAEGRLILADALHYASNVLKPSRIIDVATLTGSAETALGNEISALLCNTDSLFFLLERAAHHTGEPLWRLPLYAPYEKLLESDIADCKNVATRAGGAINAALFLGWFVDSIPWAHFDVAGTAFVKDSVRYYGKGATGIPIRTLIEFFRSLIPGIIPEVEPEELT
jgi:leucyl aminopeptidase